MLGTFSTRVEAALAFARSQLEQREAKHHARKEDRRLGKKRKHGTASLDKPENDLPDSTTAADTHYDVKEAARYTQRNALLQHELASSCLDLFTWRAGEALQSRLLLDLGCGSGLSAASIEAAGHTWVGVDVAREMLLLAAGARGGAGAALSNRGPPLDAHTHDYASGPGARCGGLIQGDMASLPLRSRAIFDGAISVSTLQWLCEGRGAGGKGGIDGGGGAGERVGALKRFFGRLRLTLKHDACAVFQWYPTSAQALQALQVTCFVRVHVCVRVFSCFCVGLSPLSSARGALFPSADTAPLYCPRTPRRATGQESEAAGFRGCLLIGMPHASRALKLFLCIQACRPGCPPDPRPLRVCPLAFPFKAACVCSSDWLPAFQRPVCVFPPVIEGVGCCTLHRCSAGPGNEGPTWATEPTWVHEEVYQACQAHRQGPGCGGGTGSVAGAHDDPRARVQTEHFKHVRRLQLRLRGTERKAPESDRLSGGMTLFVRGVDDAEGAGSACEDAALITLSADGPEGVRVVVKDVLARLGSLGLMLEHAHFDGHVPPHDAGARAHTHVTPHRRAATCGALAAETPAIEVDCVGTGVEVVSQELAVPSGAKHALYGIRVDVAERAAGARCLEAGIRAAHDSGLVVAAADLCVQARVGTAEGFLVRFELALHWRGASEAEEADAKAEPWGGRVSACIADAIARARSISDEIS